MSAADVNETAVSIVADVFDALQGEPLLRRAMDAMPVPARAALGLSLVPVVRARLSVARLPMYRDIVPLMPVAV